MPWNPQSDSVRFLGGVWLLMSFILSTVYRSNLMAMLISPSVKLPFNNFEELAKTDAKIWIPAGSRFQEALDFAEPGSKLAKVRKNYITTTNSTQGTNGFFDGKWGVTTAKMTLIYFLHLDFSKYARCNFYIMNEGVYKTTSLSLAFPKKSKMRLEVDSIIRKLREFGITDRLFRSKISNASECRKPIGSEFIGLQRPLALGDLYGVLLIYLGGLILSTLVFGTEFLQGILDKGRY